ncbi:MAG: hypothetical protein Q7W30_11010 [Coriobacteriia bacterium]|nr:hypothetical protein [Coriobacteriia bacterium]
MAVLCLAVAASAGCAPAGARSTVAAESVPVDTTSPQGVLAALRTDPSAEAWKSHLKSVRIETKLGAEVGIIETDCRLVYDAKIVTRILSTVARLRPECAPNWEVFGVGAAKGEIVFLDRWSAGGPQLRDTRKVPPPPRTPRQLESWIDEVFVKSAASEPRWHRSIESIRTESLYGFEELVIRTSLEPGSSGKEDARMIGEAIRSSRTPLCVVWTVRGRDVTILSGAFEVAGQRAATGILADGYVYTR